MSSPAITCPVCGAASHDAEGCSACVSADPYLQTTVHLLAAAHGPRAPRVALTMAETAAEMGMKETAALYRAVSKRLSARGGQPRAEEEPERLTSVPALS